MVNAKTDSVTLKPTYIHELNVHGEVPWEPAAGCGDCGLVDRLWKDLSEGAEEIAVGRMFHPETVWGKEWKRISVSVAAVALLSIWLPMLHSLI